VCLIIIFSIQFSHRTEKKYKWKVKFEVTGEGQNNLIFISNMFVISDILETITPQHFSDSWLLRSERA
jgi:hypothetical protein